MMEMIGRASLAMLLAGATAGAAAAQEGGPAVITTGAGYSSQRGPIAFVTFEGDDLFGSGVDLDISYEAGEDDHIGEIGAGKTWELGPTSLGQDTRTFFRLNGYSSEIAAQQFAHEQVSANFGFDAQIRDGFSYYAGTFWQSDDMTISDPMVSPLILADEGRSTAAGLSVGLTYSTLDRAILPTSGYRIGGTLAYAMPIADREWVAVSGNAGLAQPVGPAVLAIRGEAGVIEGLNGMPVGVLDRAFLGHDAPRGFAYGGLGPRDNDGSGVDTALGGNRYFTGSVEMRFPVGASKLSIGTFLDAGAVWDLDVTEGGASGTIDDGFHLRTAAGISGYWLTSVGLIQFNLAKPIQSQSYDEAEYLSIGLGVIF